jgi:anti-sigma regulatory factor (Ser/Thr protein kinase)
VGEAIELQVPARPDFLVVIRMVVTAFAHLHPEYGEEQVDDLRLAVSEAATNGIDAHLALGIEAPIKVACVHDATQMCVTVSDAGTGFDPGDLEPHPPVTDPARLEYERGLGIPLIMTLTDEAHFDTGSDGTSVRLVVRPAPVVL